MRKWLIAAAAVVSAETAAIACSCLATTDPAELRRIAPDAARNAVALVEVETILTYEESNGAGDRMRVVRTLAGSAPGEFRVERSEFASGASCDLLFKKGKRAVVILYPANEQSAGGATYVISNLCTGLLLEQPVFRDEVERLIDGAVKVGERG